MATLAATAGIFFEKKPTNTITRVGTLKNPINFFINSNSPFGAFTIYGATKMARIPRTVPNILPTVTSFLSSISGLTIGLYKSKQNNVEAEFKAELKELSIAPKRTAPKNPTKGVGRTLFTSIG